MKIISNINHFIAATFISFLIFKLSFAKTQIRDLRFKSRNATFIKNELSFSGVMDDDPIRVTMNSGMTENFSLSLDNFFPYNNFSIKSVIQESDQMSYFDFGTEGEYEKDCLNGETDLKCYTVDPIIYDSNFIITSDLDGNKCPEEGINIISSKAPEDQPVHMFLSDQNELFIIIFNDQTNPLQKDKILYLDLGQHFENSSLQCMDIEVFDLTNQDEDVCFISVDCNISEAFAMIFVPLFKDSTDIINDFGIPQMIQYSISNTNAANYFKSCNQRSVDNYDTTLVMYCSITSGQIESWLAFFPELNNNYKKNIIDSNNIIIISSEDIKKGQCFSNNDQSNLLIQSIVTNPLYQKNLKDYWQFALLLQDKICKCGLNEDKNIFCTSINLSNSIYTKMAYIEEEQVVTLFVGSNISIDEIQVGDGITGDGQNLIIGSVNISELKLVLDSIIINSDYIIAQMHNTTSSQITDQNIIIKIFSRNNEKNFMHYYQSINQQVNYYQNDNFYDMGDFVMIYYPNTCTLQISRVTQKPLIITSNKITESLTGITNYSYIIDGEYAQYDSSLTLFNVTIQKQLIVQLVPFSKSVLSTRTTSQQSITEQQEMVSLFVRRGVIGSLLNFLNEPRIQEDKFTVLIDYNQTIRMDPHFFENSTIFMIQINDTNKVHNPTNYRIVLSFNDDPCVVRQYFCDILIFGQSFISDPKTCKNSTIYDIKKIKSDQDNCAIDSYSEGAYQALIADKLNKIAAVCSRINKGIESTCIKIEGEWETEDGYSSVDFFQKYESIPIIVSVTADKKKIIFFQLIIDETLGTCFAAQFLTVDNQKLKSLNDSFIVQIDCVFFDDDFLFVLTSDFQIYVLTRIQQLVSNLYQSSDNNIQRDNQYKKRLKGYPDLNDSGTDKLVHVASVINLKNQEDEIAPNISCENTKVQQIFTLFGVDEDTISLIVLCYNQQFQVMQEFVFQNPFTYNWTRQFPFFGYKVESFAPHFTDLSLIYISTSLQLREGLMTAYLLYSILDYTPNSAIFQVVTCYPSYSEDSLFTKVCPPTLAESGVKNIKAYYSQPIIQDNEEPLFIGIPFSNNYQEKTISLALFFFNNQSAINYINYYPSLYAKASLGKLVTEQQDINIILSKLNLWDIHFYQYLINFDLSDSQIQLLNDTSDILSLSNNKSDESEYQLSFELPMNGIQGPIENYSMSLHYKNQSEVQSDQVTVYNSYYTDFIVLQKYFISFQDTFFKYGRVQDILNFQQYEFSTQATQDQCPDCSNLIIVISNKELVVIEIEQNYLNEEKTNPVSKKIYEYDLENVNETCSMTLYSGNRILTYCVSNTKATQFLLFEIEYNKSLQNANIKKLNMTYTGGYIGYVDEIIPFEMKKDKVYLVIKTHLILNQQISLFKIATINCEDQLCTLEVLQTIPTISVQFQDAFIVDYDIQVIEDKEEVEGKNQKIFGIFISEQDISVLILKKEENEEEDIDIFTADLNFSIPNGLLERYINSTSTYPLIFIKLLTVSGMKSISFLLGTTLNYYEFSFQFFNGQKNLTLLYTFGKYYNCEHAQGIKPLIFDLSGVPLPVQTIFYIDFKEDETFSQSPIQSVLSSCSRTSTTERPLFDPDPIFQFDEQNMFYVQYFTKIQPQQSWPVRILTFPYDTQLPPYVFEGFINSLNESRILVSNFSYFLVEHQIFPQMNITLTLSDNAADYLSINLTNGFSSQSLKFPLAFKNVIQQNHDTVWFIILIVIISVVAFIAIIFIVIWIRKQKVQKQPEKKKTPRLVSSEISDLSDLKIENHQQAEKRTNTNADIRLNNNYPHAPPSNTHANIGYHRTQRNLSMSGGGDLDSTERFASRLSLHVDNLLRSVSMMKDGKISKINFEGLQKENEQ